MVPHLLPEAKMLRMAVFGLIGTEVPCVMKIILANPEALRGVNMAIESWSGAGVPWRRSTSSRDRP